ncbi:MucR family transcriptional regulator [Alsobacter sp. SYSU M60028]|uniref:MucR family transcriptional regulator n=1 Tax=Alsobacter ponti TaxID=2962936 RepID=A0ABT1L8U3_9HYPH|nr:MucR family transcriptional regulator [Alsobacter ponti]MCP8937343.1 MucR family transcriptional regulator [Alsobacter ponti]
MGDDGQHIDLLALTANLVASYVAKNALGPADLSRVIRDVHAALARAAAPFIEMPVEHPTPPISIKKSITRDYLISFEDGRHYKTLTRHLGVRGMTPDQYRAKWSLPKDYPMVAASYAARRSEIAKELGLGQMRKKVVAQEPKPAPARKSSTTRRRGKTSS